MGTATKFNITIKSWEKFNPRKDVKATTWFRLNNDLFENPDFFELEHVDICAWIYLLSIASKRQSGEFVVALEHAVRIGRFGPEQFVCALEKFRDLGLITFTTHARDADVTPTSLYERTNERTDVEKHADVTSTLREKPPLDPMALLEAKFSPDAARVDGALDQAFAFVQAKVPRSLRGAGGRLLVAFQGFDDFKENLENILNSPNCTNARYLEVAILRSSGMIAERAP